jgi:hypothetical protein
MLLIIAFVFVMIGLTVSVYFNIMSFRKARKKLIAQVPAKKEEPNSTLQVEWRRNMPKKCVRWIQPIFIPSKAYLKLHEAVLKGLSSYQKRYKTLPNVDLSIHAAGWALNDELWNEYMSMWTLYMEPDVPIPVRIAHNYGQAYIYNMFYQQWIDDSVDFIVTTGCDLYLEESVPPTLHQIVSSFDVNERCGLISYNMCPDNVHGPNTPTNVVRVDIKNTLVSEPLSRSTLILSYMSQGGVAGSCSVIRWKALKEVNGYKVRGVYSPEDGNMNSDLMSHDWQMYIADTCYVVHRLDHTLSCPLFTAWKKRSLKFGQEQTENILDEERLLPWALESEAIFQSWLKEPRHL